MDIEIAAASLPVIEEHKEGLANLLATLLKLEEASGRLLVSHLIPEETLYRHIVGQFSSNLPEAITEAKLTIKNKHLVHDAVEVLNRFRASTPFCSKCRKLTLGHDGRTWVTRNVGERCIHCSAVVVWEVFNAKHWSWVTEQDESNARARIHLNGEDVPSTPDEIKVFLDSMGGLHHDVDARIKKHSVDLPRFLLALWKTYSSLVFRNKRMRVLWAVSLQKHETFEFSEADLDALVLMAKKVGTSAPVQAPQQKTGGCAIESFRSINRGDLRKLLNANLLTDSDLMAFITDYAPLAVRRISNGMETSAKITTLFEMGVGGEVGCANSGNREPYAILVALYQYLDGNLKQPD